MTQARVVIRGAALEMGEHLLEVTRLASLTELINVMFSRYGKHLEATWEVLPLPNAKNAQLEPIPVMTIPAPKPEADFKFEQPIIGL